MLGSFSCIYYRLLTFFKINFLEKFFQEHYQSVKQFGFRSGPAFFLVCHDMAPNCLQRLSADDKISTCLINLSHHYQSVKQFGSRSGPTFCQSGSKLFAKVISRQQSRSMLQNLPMRGSGVSALKSIKVTDSYLTTNTSSTSGSSSGTI